MSTRSFGCQCPEVSLSEASTQVNEKIIDNNVSCSVSRVVVNNVSYVRIIQPNICLKSESVSTKSYQLNDKFTMAKAKTRSIGTSKLNFSAVQTTIEIPVQKSKPKIISNVLIPTFINPLGKGKERYKYLPKETQFKLKDKEYIPTPNPDDPINDVV